MPPGSVHACRSYSAATSRTLRRILPRLPGIVNPCRSRTCCAVYIEPARRRLYPFAAWAYMDHGTLRSPEVRFRAGRPGLWGFPRCLVPSIAIPWMASTPPCDLFPVGSPRACPGLSISGLSAGSVWPWLGRVWPVDLLPGGSPGLSPPVFLGQVLVGSGLGPVPVVSLPVACPCGCFPVGSSRGLAPCGGCGLRPAGGSASPVVSSLWSPRACLRYSSRP